MSRFKISKSWVLYAMLVPSAITLILFSYYPMFGIIISFQNFSPVKGFFGSEFVGLKWYHDMLLMPDFKYIIRNTIVIALGKIATGLVVPVFFALLLNEVKHIGYKKAIQTIVYLPHFLSWVIVGGIFVDILAKNGIVNQFLGVFGISPILFLMDNQYFQPTLIFTETWKSFGWGAIIYLAALTNINPELYESAALDGANRIKQIVHITLPGIMNTIILMSCLSLGNVLNAGFDQILVLYNPTVYRSGDVIDTFVYRQGLVSFDFSMSTAVGLFKSIIGFTLLVTANKLAKQYAGYRIF